MFIPKNKKKLESFGGQTNFYNIYPDSDLIEPKNVGFNWTQIQIIAFET